MPADVVEMPAPADLESTALSVPQQADALTISDQASYDRAAAFLVDTIKPMRDRITEYHAPLKKKAHESWMAICDAERGMLDPIKQAEITIKSRLAIYEAEQRRIEAERARREQEEQDRQVAQMREAAAIAAIDAGADQETVDAIVSMPVSMPRPIATVPAFRQAAGISTRTAYKGEVKDMAELVKAAVGGNALAASILTVDESKLNALARVQGAQLERLIPGIRVREVPVVAAGRRR